MVAKTPTKQVSSWSSDQSQHLIQEKHSLLRSNTCDTLLSPWASQEKIITRNPLCPLKQQEKTWEKKWMDLPQMKILVRFRKRNLTWQPWARTLATVRFRKRNLTSITTYPVKESTVEFKIRNLVCLPYGWSRGTLFWSLGYLNSRKPNPSVYRKIKTPKKKKNPGDY